MRVSTACLACRSRRRKCQTPQFGSACTYCNERGLACTRDTQTMLRPTRPPQIQQNQKILPSEPTLDLLASPQSPLDTFQLFGLPPKEVCLELVSLYFDYIHDQFHSLFHPPTLLQEVENETASPMIIFSVMALSARFSSSPMFDGTNPRRRGDEYARQATRLLDLRDMSLATIQTCVLLGAFAITCGESGAESVYYSAAARIARIMDLSANHITIDVLEAEVNRRVWWSLCMIDVWSSTGVNLPRQMPALENLPLPMDDVHYLRLKPGEFMSPSLSAVPTTAPLLAEMIKLNRILIQVNNLNMQTVNNPLSPVELETRVSTLSNTLSSWHAALPPNMHDTPENLAHWASLGLGRMFIAVYLGYYHFGQLLFYQFLHGDALSTVLSAKYYAQRCKSFAEALCSIVYASHSTPGCDVQYTMVGHILVIASTIQIHTLLFSEDDRQISAARSRLERNFEILMKLRDVWPTLDVSFTRLRAFHKACRDSMDESFRLDVWMLRFLSEFAVVVDDKEVLAMTPVDLTVWSWEGLGSPLSVREE